MYDTCHELFAFIELVRRAIHVTNSQMFDFHTADAIASYMLTMAVCSIGADLVLEYSALNPA